MVPGMRRPSDERLRQLWFDASLYNKESLELLFKIVGTDRSMFGTERPGAGAKTDPRTGRWYDDTKPLINDIDWLTDEQREQVFPRKRGAGVHEIQGQGVARRPQDKRPHSTCREAPLTLSGEGASLCPSLSRKSILLDTDYAGRDAGDWRPG